MSQNLNENAKEQMIEQLSKEELSALIEKKNAFEMLSTRLRFAQLEHRVAQLEFAEVQSFLKSKYTINDKDQISLETGVIQRV